MQPQNSPLANTPMVNKANIKINEVNTNEYIWRYYKLLSAISKTVLINSMVSINNSIKQYGSTTSDSNNQVGMY